MDYDRTVIPAAYDAGRGYRRAVMRQWLDRVAAHAPGAAVDTIVDLGAGTGRYSQALAERFDAVVFAVEPSRKMRAELSRKCTDARVRILAGTGEALPLVDGATDLVFLSMVFHHLAQPERVARECRRVLRPGGRVCLRNSTVDRMESFPHVRFFNGIRTVIKAALPHASGIREAFCAGGLIPVAHEVVDHETAISWTAQAERWSHRADSLLAHLPDATFEAGMARLRAHAPSADPVERVSEDVDFFVFER